MAVRVWSRGGAVGCRPDGKQRRSRNTTALGKWCEAIDGPALRRNKGSVLVVVTMKMARPNLEADNARKRGIRTRFQGEITS